MVQESNHHRFGFFNLNFHLMRAKDREKKNRKNSWNRPFCVHKIAHVFKSGSLFQPTQPFLIVVNAILDAIIEVIVGNISGVREIISEFAGSSWTIAELWNQKIIHYKKKSQYGDRSQVNITWTHQLDIAPRLMIDWLQIYKTIKFYSKLKRSCRGLSMFHSIANPNRFANNFYSLHVWHFTNSNYAIVWVSFANWFSNLGP